MARYVLNPFTASLDADSSTIVASSDPASADNGQWLINTTTGLLKIYYAGAWHTIFTFPSTGSKVLLESGDGILMEDGNNMILEGAAAGSNFLFEDGTDFLFEDSTTFLFET